MRILLVLFSFVWTFIKFIFFLPLYIVYYIFSDHYDR